MSDTRQDAVLYLSPVEQLADERRSDISRRPGDQKSGSFHGQKKAALANTGAAFIISFRNILLQFLLHLDDLVAFDGVAHFNVIVVFNGQAAFQSGAYFLDIVLEALE